LPASMNAILPNATPPAKLTSPCPACKRGVIRTVDDHGRVLVLEWCRPEKGTHTITAGLLPGIEPTATLSAGKGYRVHACPSALPAQSHTAASFAGKRGSPSISYRSFDRPRKRRP
jgi:hypothetical protein